MTDSSPASRPRRRGVDALKVDDRGRVDLKCFTRAELVDWVQREIGGDEALAIRI